MGARERFLTSRDIKEQGDRTQVQRHQNPTPPHVLQLRVVAGRVPGDVTHRQSGQPEPDQQDSIDPRETAERREEEFGHLPPDLAGDKL